VFYASPLHPFGGLSIKIVLGTAILLGYHAPSGIHIGANTPASALMACYKKIFGSCDVVPVSIVAL
jgi:hypothetical protein